MLNREKFRLFRYRLKYGRGLKHIPYHWKKRDDSKARWQLMAPRIDEKDESCIDIGCADGYFVKQFSNLGLLTMGVDQSKESVQTARALYADQEGASFMNYWITPDSIQSIPSFDVILLLTVYHHWVTQNGHGEAERMLKVLADKSKKIFFEPPGYGRSSSVGYIDKSEKHSDEPLGGRPIGEDESGKEYYYEFFGDIFDESQVNIDYLGEVDYSSGHDRSDPLFVIECDNYQYSE